ncbi:MAG: YigZ family protein [Bacilli bacterium]|nr:YigZ family protein [Bacilli bacterium]
MANTINQEVINQIEVMKSKFIAYLTPLKKEEDFKPLLANLRKEHKKARHIVYAYRIGVKSKSCDDGEPKGTAGHPLLELLYKKDLTDVALLVVRYFGGTKLGAGRLLRTYLQAGINAVDNCTLINLER